MKKIIAILIILTLCNVHQALGAKAILDKSYALQEYGGEFNLDPIFSLYVNEITEDIASVIDSDRSYFTVVLNDMEADAWILPDGTMGMTRGLLRLVDDEGELAALIAQQLLLAKSVLAVDRVGPVYGSFLLRKYEGGGYALGEANAALSFILYIFRERKKQKLILPLDDELCNVFLKSNHGSLPTPPTRRRRLLSTRKSIKIIQKCDVDGKKKQRRPKSK